MYFRVENDAGGNPTWKLYSSNGQLVAWAGETFYTTYNATRAATAFRAGASAARFETYLDNAGHYRWRAIRGGNKVAASGEAFSSKASADRAAENVRVNAGTASGL